MSRLRKGNKYKGASFADQFKSACAMKSPLYAEVPVAGKTEEPLPTSPTDNTADKTATLEQSGAAGATVKNLSPKDEVPTKVGSAGRMAEREAWMARNKQKAQDRADEAERLKAEEAAAEELAETKRYRDADGNLVYLKENRETVAIRTNEPRNYLVTIHFYNARKNPAPLVHATVKLIKINPYREEYHKKLFFSQEGQELPAMVFRIDYNGNVDVGPTEELIIRDEVVRKEGA